MSLLNKDMRHPTRIPQHMPPMSFFSRPTCRGNAVFWGDEKRGKGGPMLVAGRLPCPLVATVILTASASQFRSNSVLTAHVCDCGLPSFPPCTMFLSFDQLPCRIPPAPARSQAWANSGMESGRSLYLGYPGRLPPSMHGRGQRPHLAGPAPTPAVNIITWPAPPASSFFSFSLQQAVKFQS